MRFTRKFKIPNFDVDKNRRLSYPAIIKYFGEIATLHSDSLIPIDSLSEMGYGWMINKWYVEILELAKANEEIILETWVSKVERFFSIREFRILDRSGRPLVKGSSLWMFMDIKKRRPVRIPEEYEKMMSPINEGNIYDFPRETEEDDFENEEIFDVRRLDIDMNNHVNNLNYYIWMLESIDDEIYENYNLSKFKIHYKSEVSYPAIIRSRNKIIEEKDYIRIIHSIVSIDGDLDHTYGETLWSKKQIKPI